MSIFHLFLIAVIQGLTEFLPVSSSAHLILLPSLTRLADQGQIIDVAVHVGTLFAVMLYFRKEVLLAVSGVPRMLTGHIDTAGAKLAFLLTVGTVPVVLLGFVLKLTGLNITMRSIEVIGWAMLLFGILLYWTDQHGTSEKSSQDWSLKDAVIMGLCQAIALVPGTSRSGITITAARKLGYGRQDAARLSMLMSIPTIFASGVFLGAEVIATSNISAARDGAIAAAFAFFAALLALTLMMRLLQKVSYTPYVVYRIILGSVLLWIAYT